MISLLKMPPKRSADCVAAGAAGVIRHKVGRDRAAPNRIAKARAVNMG